MIKLLDAQTQGWQPLEADGVGAALDRHLTSILLAERFVVLTGLGTSRCVTDGDGKPLAPTMGDLWEAAKGIGGDRFAQVLEQAGWDESWRDDIELLLSRCQMALELKSDEALRTFLVETEAAIVAACRFVSPGQSLPTHEAFLRRVARRSTNLPRTQLFTTNYDLAFETAAAATGFAIIDGFSHTYPQRFDGGYFDQDFASRDRERAAAPIDWVPNVLQLHKLHGSVDWLETHGEVRRDLTVERPLIIYPRFSKFEASYQQPFLELMARFQAALRRPETGLLIVGSGFNDDHITQPIMAALRANVRLTAIIVSPGLAESENENVKAIRQLIEGGDRRLALMAATFEQLVPLVPDLVAETQAERHQARLSAATDG